MQNNTNILSLYSWWPLEVFDRPLSTEGGGKDIYL